MKIAIQIILFAAICTVAYFVVESVQKPLRFNAEKDARYDVTIQRLKDIRTAQLAFRSEHREYTNCFDTLINFLKNGKFRVVMIIGDEDDSASVAAGVIKRDTILVSVMDSLFQTSARVDSMRFVPFTKGIEFDLDTANLRAGNVMVNVFEAKISNDVLLNGLDPQLLVNFNSDRRKKTGYAGLKVGSLTETTNNAGNWEW